MIDLSQLIQYGPWCVLSFYLLFRFEKTLKKNTDATTNLIVYLNGNKK